MKRTDIHLPSNLILDDYSFIAVYVFDAYNSLFLAVQRKIFIAHREQTKGNFATHSKNSGCDICGAHCVHHAVFYHHPSNEYLKIGLDCAAKMESGLEDTFKRARTEQEAVKKAKAGKMKAWGLLQEHKIKDVVSSVFDEHFKHKTDVVTQDVIKEFTFAVNVSNELVSKLVKYGSISNKQFGLFEKLCNELKNNKEKIEEKYNMESMIPELASGRMDVVGKIISLKYDEFYENWKMTVKTEQGWIIMCNRPTAFEDCNKGDTVSFSANIVKSDKKHFIGFGKRPTKTKILEKVVDK
jgi:transposase-like protein